ncbi:hypothetical protein CAUPRSCDRAFT_10507 [Caulochytrium protostelioides]|nr:hypothetical protein CAUPRSCDRAFT_10507 [Caulochytrium protostelioides]
MAESISSPSGAGCTKQTIDLGVGMLRYQLSFWCSKAVSDGLKLGCKDKSGGDGRNFLLCADSCSAATVTLQTLYTNSTLCPSDNSTLVAARTSLANQFQTNCRDWSSGADASTCWTGTALEAQSCGFHDAQRAKAYCPANDPCCKELLSGKSSRATTAGASAGKNSDQIMGMSKVMFIGVLIVVVLVVLAIVTFVTIRMRRAKKNQRPPLNGTGPNYRKSFGVTSPPAVATAYQPMNSSRGPPLSATPLSAMGHSIEKTAPNSSAGPRDEDPEFVAAYVYEAQMDDEIDLAPGDFVTVLQAFADGWCHGHNHRTGLTGMLPLSVLQEAANYNPNAAGYDSRMTMPRSERTVSIFGMYDRPDSRMPGKR